MIHHERLLEIDTTPNAVWAVLKRFMHIDEFAPQVKSVEALTDGANGIGSRRRCHFANGTSLVEEVTSWQANRGYGVRLSEMSAMPLNEAHAAIKIDQLQSSRVRVTWSMDYHPKLGVLGWIIGQTLMKAMITRVLDDNLKALAERVQNDTISQGLPV